MSICALRCPNQPPAIHWSEPMPESLAWWCKIHLSCLPPQQKIREICFEMISLGTLMIRQTGLLVRSNSRVTTQISSNYSNLHSPLPILTGIGIFRGFLPRGLSDACPVSSAGSWLDCD